MVKNEEVVKSFVCGSDNKSKNLFCEDRVLYSYGYHFPLCVKFENGFIINSNGYSNTTAQHKGILIRAITQEDNFKDFEKNKNKCPNIILMDTEKINRILPRISEQNIKTIEQLKDLLIIENL